MKRAAKAKRGASKMTGLDLHIEVLQNGATLVHKVKPLGRVGTLALTSASDGEFALPHYPIPQGKLEFLKRSGSGVTLIVDHQWEGFCTSKGELVHIERGDRGRQQLPLYKGDYASITHDDLRIMVKLIPHKKAKKAVGVKGTDARYRKGLVNLFFPTVEEKRGILLAALMALIILGGAGLGLKRRPVHRPAQLDQIGEPFMLPFIAPKHLETGPEALQENLDRRQNARSVLEYYQSFTAALMGWPHVDARLLLPTTIELYRDLHAAARAVASEKMRLQQEVDRLQGMKSDASVFPVPAVIGETMAGSMLRVIDKIDVMHAGLDKNLAAKREIIQTFPKDPEYSYEEYRNLSKVDDKAQEYLSQIRPWQKFTDEEMMYAEAATLSKRAERVQRRMLRNKQASDMLSPDELPPIEIPAGAKFASFVGDVDMMELDEKIYQLQGSEYGVPQKVGPSAAIIKEPLVGQIDPKVVESFIRENKYQLQLCYELALRRNEGAAGTMEWRWRIDSRGSISDVALLSSSINDPRMATCIRQKISTWRFPRPRRGSVEVSYPFEFAPAKG
jgi:hypothetical protein